MSNETKIENGGPAFPVHPGVSLDEFKGMFLRDYFAGMALQGMLAYSYVNPSSGNYHENCSVEGVAASAYRYADAMLAARKAKP